MGERDAMPARLDELYHSGAKSGLLDRNENAHHCPRPLVYGELKIVRPTAPQRSSSGNG
jgi:hypothetical protein